jgi:hypothetical protein
VIAISATSVANSATNNAANSAPPIGIGGSHYRLRPCHTTRHAGPHRAVGTVEVMQMVSLLHTWFRQLGFGKIGSLAATPLQASPAPTL